MACALYLDDGDGVADAPDEGDVLVDECVTGDDGTCTIGGLHLGDYYWYETQAPEGYLIPDDATTDVVTISAENAGTGLSVAAFLDPPLPTTPPPDLPDTGLSISPWLMGLVAAVLIATGEE